MGISFFYGDEDYLIDLEIKKAKNSLDENFLAMNFSEYNYNEKDKKKHLLSDLFINFALIKSYSNRLYEYFRA